MAFWIRDEDVIAKLEVLAKRKGLSVEKTLFEAVQNQLAITELGLKLRRELKKLVARHRKVLASQQQGEPPANVQMIACAKVHRVPLLCKGSDFKLTDIKIA